MSITTLWAQETQRLKLWEYNNTLTDTLRSNPWNSTFIRKGSDGSYIALLSGTEVSDIITIDSHGNKERMYAYGDCPGKYISNPLIFKDHTFYFRIVDRELNLVGFNINTKKEVLFYPTSIRIDIGFDFKIMGSNNANLFIELNGKILVIDENYIHDYNLKNDGTYFVCETGLIYAYEGNVLFLSNSGQNTLLHHFEEYYSYSMHYIRDYDKGEKYPMFCIRRDSTYLVKLDPVNLKLDTLFTVSDRGDALYGLKIDNDTTYLIYSPRISEEGLNSLFLCKVKNRQLIKKSFLMNGKIQGDLNSELLVAGRDSAIFVRSSIYYTGYFYSVNYNSETVSLSREYVLKSNHSISFFSFPNVDFFYYTLTQNDGKYQSTACYADSSGAIKYKEFQIDTSSNPLTHYYDYENSRFYLGHNKNGRIHYEEYNASFDKTDSLSLSLPNHRTNKSVMRSHKTFTILSDETNSYFFRKTGALDTIHYKGKPVFISGHIGDLGEKYIYQVLYEGKPAFAAIDTIGNILNIDQIDSTFFSFGSQFRRITKDGKFSDHFVVFYSRENTRVVIIDSENFTIVKDLNLPITYYSLINTLYETSENKYVGGFSRGNSTYVAEIDFEAGSFTHLDFPQGPFNSCTTRQDLVLLRKNSNWYRFIPGRNELIDLNVTAFSIKTLSDNSVLFLQSSGGFVYYDLINGREYPFKMERQSDYKIIEANDRYYFYRNFQGTILMDQPFVNQDTSFAFKEVGVQDNLLYIRVVDYEKGNYKKSGGRGLENFYFSKNTSAGTICYFKTNTIDCVNEFYEYDYVNPGALPVLKAYAEPDSLYNFGATFVQGNRVYFPAVGINEGLEFYYYEIKDDVITNNYAKDHRLDWNLSGLKLYPNPASDFVNIDSDVGITEIMIYDLSGRIIKEFQIENQTSVGIPLLYLADGMYVVKVYTKENGFKSVLFAKRKMK